jgi:hypothetical protein
MSNTNFRSVENTVVSTSTVAPILDAAQVVAGYHLFNTAVLTPVVIVAAATTAVLTTDDLRTAKDQSSGMGLLIDARALSAACNLVLPEPDTAAGAKALQVNLGLVNVGDQCTLKFSLMANVLAMPAFAVGFENPTQTQVSVAFSDFGAANGVLGQLFESTSVGISAYVVATNTGATAGSETMVFTTLQVGAA